MFGSKVIVPPIWGDISGGGDLRLRIMAISIPRQWGGKFAGSLASLCLLVLDAVVEHTSSQVWFDFLSRSFLDRQPIHFLANKHVPFIDLTRTILDKLSCAKQIFQLLPRDTDNRTKTRKILYSKLVFRE